MVRLATSLIFSACNYAYTNVVQATQKKAHLTHSIRKKLPRKIKICIRNEWGKGRRGAHEK